RSLDLGKPEHGLFEMLLRVVQIRVDLVNPGIAPEEVAAGLGAQKPPVGLLKLFNHERRIDVGPADLQQRAVQGLAEAVDARKGVFLSLRTGPLHEVRAVMPAGVPGAGADTHLAPRAVSVQIIVNESRLDFRVAAPNPVEQFPVTDLPEIALRTRVPEPAAIVAIRGREDQRWKLAMLGALVDLLHEPARVHAGELGVRQLAVADDDDDFLVLEAGEMRPVADFLPAHRLERFDITAVH